jgi:hypothetical protein
MKLTWENQNTRRKTCPNATLSITNPTWTDPGSNMGLRGDEPPEPWHGLFITLLIYCKRCEKPYIFSYFM